VGVEGAEVTKANRDIRVVAGECPERAKAMCTDLRGPAENPDLLSRLFFDTEDGGSIFHRNVS
jgi:hypothetical protein